jgi:hypothetical protein
MAAKSTRPKAARAVASGTPSTAPRPGGVAKAFYVEKSRKGEHQRRPRSAPPNGGAKALRSVV